jgi:glutamate 5-kinase
MSVGGMRTKLQAVDFALSHGITTFIVDGRKTAQISAALNGEDVGTEFLPASRRENEQMRT